MENDVKKMPRWAKRTLYALGGVMLLLIGIICLGLYIPDIMRWKIDRESVRYEEKLEAERQQLAAMEKADTYGSTTPEGTVALIAAALEAGDTVLASKYYYVLDREKALASFNHQRVEKGNLDIAITFFKDLLRGTKGCNKEGDGCTLRYEYLTEKDEMVQLPGAKTPMLFEKGSKSTKANDFQKNQYTGIWKAMEM